MDNLSSWKLKWRTKACGCQSHIWLTWALNCYWFPIFSGYKCNSFLINHLLHISPEFSAFLNRMTRCPRMIFTVGVRINPHRIKRRILLLASYASANLYEHSDDSDSDWPSDYQYLKQTMTVGEEAPRSTDCNWYSWVTPWEGSNIPLSADEMGLTGRNH